MKFKLFTLAFVATLQLATAVSLNSVHRHLRTGHKGHKCLHGVKGICGLPSACTGGKLKRGHCKGGKENICCVKRSKHGHRGHKCLHGVEGICGLPSACTGGELKSGHCKGGSENVCCVSDSEEEPSKSSSSGETFDVSDSEEEPSKSSSSGETFDFAKRESKEEKAYNSLTAKPVRTTRPPEKREEKGWWDSFKDNVADGTKRMVDGAKHYSGKVVDGAKHYGGKVVHHGGRAWNGAKEIADEYVVKPIQHHGGKAWNSAKKTAEEYVVKPIQHAGEKVGIDIFGSRDERGNPEYESALSHVHFSKEQFGLAMIAIVDSYSENQLQASKLTQLEKITVRYEGKKVWNSDIVRLFKKNGMAYARVKVYKGPRGNCYVAYRGSNILHDWVINARLKSYKIKEKVKLTSIKHFTRSIAANMHEIYTKYIREFTRGDYKNENGQCVHKGFFEHMMLSLDKVRQRLKIHKCTPEKTICVGHSLGGATASNAAAVGVCKTVYSIGAPRPFCGQCPKELKDVKSYRFVNAYRYSGKRARDYKEL